MSACNPKDTMDKIRNYMQETLMSMPGETPVGKAARKMREHGIGSILVETNGQYVGILTDADFTRRVVAEELDPKTTTLKSVMSVPLIKLDQDLPMADAFFYMHKNQIRHILAVDGEKVVGILSFRDCAKFFNRKHGMENDPVAEFWDNYEALLGEATFTYAIKKLLREFRKKLPAPSLTAKAIDDEDPLDKIAACAEKEGFLDFAEVLRFSGSDE